MVFKTEAEFEEALIAALKNKGWDEVIKYPTEEDLIRNWAEILFMNNKQIDHLNNVPLTESEMSQLMEKILADRTPAKLNEFINGKTTSIIRDNPEDKLNYGKAVTLDIYDRDEIAAGKSKYQIVQQPIFKSKSKILNDRRGDLMLLINGMPVIHIELKKSGVSVSQAYHQIEKYSHEGIFSGIFSLVQVFVAMNPEETVYFANPGPDGIFNEDFYFHWADFNNEPVNDWLDITSKLLSIPMAHQLIGFYTIADDSDGILKVMRSYQYYAANAISDKVSKINWEDKNLLGGYIWHTTGSGKTMTSFKSAQLIANSKDADKVIFLMDRIELGTQSLREYNNFASDGETIQGTENTHVLIQKMKSDLASDTLIVTSIQKMSNIKEDGILNEFDLKKMNSKRIVFIVDEAHRSTFGEMLITIKSNFPHAVFFGFTGTPIQEENVRKDTTTAMIFGNELHRYSIADGIRDGNVLGFDPYKVNTYKDRDIREAVALNQAHADSVAEAIDDPVKSKTYYQFMNDIPMAGYKDAMGNKIKGIEDYVRKVQYNCNEHREMVIQDIADNWLQLSKNGMFHAIFATSSINEAIKYYRLTKQKLPNLNITALFDPNIDNTEGAIDKEDGLLEIMEDYNKKYKQNFNFATHGKFKKDVAARLAHKSPYKYIDKQKGKQIDILIVVDQMLTGFDSKWINTLYIDKVLKYENVIQAFSRTNRLFRKDLKPFGTIRYYRYPNTMENNIADAIKLYSGDKPFGLFVEKLPYNLKKMNDIFEDIKMVFEAAGVKNFEKLPESMEEQGKFASLFSQFNEYMSSAAIQGFTWDVLEYENQENGEVIKVALDESTYLTLVQRYKEIGTSEPGEPIIEVPFDIDGYLTEIDTGKIDNDYMNSRFEKYLKQLMLGNMDPEELQKSLDQLHKAFASLNQEEQKYANIFLHDVQSGNVVLEEGKTFREYITEYQANAQNSQVYNLANALGLDVKKLAAMMTGDVTKATINEYGRFDDLRNSVDEEKAKVYLEKIKGVTLSKFKLRHEIFNLLEDFILSGGYDIKDNNIQYEFAEESLELGETASLAADVKK